MCGMCLGHVEPEKCGPNASPMAPPHRQGCPLLHTPQWTGSIPTPQLSKRLLHRQEPQSRERAHCQDWQLKIPKTLLSFLAQRTTGNSTTPSAFIPLFQSMRQTPAEQLETRAVKPSPTQIASTNVVFPGTHLPCFITASPTAPRLCPARHGSPL